MGGPNPQRAPPGARVRAPQRLRRKKGNTRPTPATPPPGGTPSIATCAQGWAPVEADAGDSPRCRVTDKAAIGLFLTDLAALLDESVELIGALPASRASPELVSAHAAAWADLKDRSPLSAVLSELEARDTTGALNNVGLAGVQLGFKLTGWFRALTEWGDARTLDALRRAFRYANLVLGSLGQALRGPGLDMFKEFKEGTEAVLDEATPPGGYLPAPAYSWARPL
jgi:hypothetical protein